VKKLRQGFSWWCFENRGIAAEDLLLGAAKLGYEYVDLIGEPLWPLVHQCGLNLGAVPGHTSIECGLNDPAQAGRIECELLASIEKATKWNIPILICFSGNKLGDTERSLDQCAQVLAKVAPAAEDAGITLAMELLNSKIDHKGYECDSTAWGLRLRDRVNSPALKLLYDIYHMQVMEGDLIRTIEAHHPHFAHYHTAGNPGRGQPDDTQEIHYPAIYRAIARTGADPIVSHEFVPSADPLAALASAYNDCVRATASLES